MKRRSFLKYGSYAGIGIAGLGTLACSKPKVADETTEGTPEKAAKQLYKISLAQWSFNRAIRSGKMDAFDFATKAKSMGFEGIEYVNQLYEPYYLEKDNMLEAIKQMGSTLKQRASDAGIPSLLIMVDHEPSMGTQDVAKRNEAVAAHHKWVDLASHLDCHSIRINLSGDGSREAQIAACSESMGALSAYAKDFNINVIVENHGGFSSDPNWLKEIMDNINMDNCGTLPDFGNFCIKRGPNGCEEAYPDIYQGVQLMLPYAKALSAKSNVFDDKGDEKNIDYYRMMKITKDSGYKGYVGVEYEGASDEEEGIILTKKLLEKAMSKLG